MIDDFAAAKAATCQALFATPVIVSQLPPDDDLIAELLAVVGDRRAAHETAGRSNKGGWQSDTAMLQWGGEPARKLARIMIHLCNRYTTDIGQTEPDKPRFEWSAEMWANVNPAGGGHESHTHPGALWSAVFYVDDGLAEGEAAELAGELVVQDPRNPTPVMYRPDLRFLEADGSVYRSDHRFTPRVGQIVAFPSWVAHWVTPHAGTRERIAIALNTVAVPARADVPRQSKTKQD